MFVRNHSAASRSAGGRLAKTLGRRAWILEAVDRVNNAQKNVLFDKLSALFDEHLLGKTVGIWGLAFKPRTDDVREAPSMTLIRRLLDADVAVRVYDPEAMDNVRKVYGDRITDCPRAADAAKGANALVLVTEWQELHNPNFDLLKRLLKQPIVVDGRNLFDPAQMAALGFVYAGIGREGERTNRRSWLAADVGGAAQTWPSACATVVPGVSAESPS